MISLLFFGFFVITSIYVLTMGFALHRFFKLRNATFGRIFVILMLAYVKVASDYIWLGTFKTSWNLNQIFSIGNFFGALALYYFTSLLAKEWFPLHIKIIRTALNIVVFLALLGFGIEFLSPDNPRFLYLMQTSNGLSFAGNPFFAMLIFVFFALLTLMFSNLYLELKKFPSKIIDSDTRRSYKWIFGNLALGLTLGFSAIMIIPSNHYLFQPSLMLAHFLISLSILIIFH